MTWADPSPGMPADDYTREHKALYDRIRAEAAHRPVPDPDPSWFDDGPTAQWAAHREEQAWADALDLLVTELAGNTEPEAA